MANKPSHFSSSDILPAELLAHIFSYLSPQDLSNVELVNKLWAEIAAKPYLWQNLIKEYLPFLEQAFPTEYIHSPQVLFQREYQIFIKQFNADAYGKILLQAYTNNSERPQTPPLDAFVLSALRGEFEKIEASELPDAIKNKLFILATANGHIERLPKLSENEKIEAFCETFRFGNLSALKLLFPHITLNADIKRAAMLQATCDGQLETVRYLLSMLEEEKRHEVMAFALSSAAMRNHIHLVREFFAQAKESFDSKSIGDALNYAADCGAIECVHEIFTRGGELLSIQQIDKALENAAYRDHLAIVELFLERNENSAHGLVKALNTAAHKGSFAVFKRLFNDSNLPISDDLKEDALACAIENGYKISGGNAAPIPLLTLQYDKVSRKRGRPIRQIEMNSLLDEANRFINQKRARKDNRIF